VRVGVGPAGKPHRRLVDEQLERLVQKTIEAFGRIDIVVNNAGGTGPNSIAKTSRKRFLESFDFNVVSAFSLTRICLPYLQESNGCVINISSAVGRLFQRRFSVYGTVKAGLTSMTRMMAADLAPDIRVNAVAPGFFLNERMRFQILDQNGNYTPRGKTIISHTPMNRLGMPEDLIGNVVWLASDASKFVTGVSIPVDGGFNAYAGV
jgi:7-alpha-hydroxysteroid dehydrogenase